MKISVKKIIGSVIILLAIIAIVTSAVILIKNIKNYIDEGKKKTDKPAATIVRDVNPILLDVKNNHDKVYYLYKTEVSIIDYAFEQRDDVWDFKVVLKNNSNKDYDLRSDYVISMMDKDGFPMIDLDSGMFSTVEAEQTLDASIELNIDGSSVKEIKIYYNK